MIFLLCYIQWIIFSALYLDLFIYLFIISCTHAHTATSLLNFLSDKRSPKLVLPPLRGQVDQPPAVEVRGSAVKGKKVPLFCIAKRNGWKAVSFESLKRKINYGNERKSHKKTCEGGKFCFKNNTVTVQLVCNVSLIGLTGFISSEFMLCC